MKKLSAVLFFVAITFLSWGSYGPTLHLGTDAMGHSRWRPFLCVGMAYFLVAVLVPLLMLGKEEKGKWTFGGTTFSFFAGCIGAVGALGIVFAFKAGAKPIYIMPLVFGGAPVINTLVTMFINKTYRKVNIPFFLAIALVAIGAAGVMRYKPKPPKAVAAAHVEENVSEESASDAKDKEKEDDDEAEHDEAEHGDHGEEDQSEKAGIQWFNAMAAILMTAICWGSYGPILHLGQARMQGSRLRPFICVGMAYFVIGVIVPAVILMKLGESGQWTVVGTLWSLAAGAAGAIGAMGIIMAFNSGGKPIFVMPLVFGFAPVINTIDSLGLGYLKTGAIGEMSKPFLFSLGLVITGAVCVLLFAPKGKKPAPPTEEVAEDPAADETTEQEAANAEAT